MIPYQVVFKSEKSDSTMIMCSYCSKKFQTVQQHEQHRCRKERNCNGECLSCEKPYTDHKAPTSGSGLEKDLETSKMETDNSSVDKTTATCDVPNTNSLSYRCCICHKDFPNIPYMIRHIKYHRSRKTDVPQPEQCGHCNKVFTNKRQLARHEATHNDGRPFQCEKCDKLFKTSDSMKRHMYVHSDATPFSCSICNKQFKAKHLMKKHEETHSDAKNYECPKCGKKFKARNSLRDHLLVHNGIRPYKCDECDQAFYRRSHLATHKTTHSDVKPFLCKVCGKGFGRREHLKVHERIHSGEKPFECNQCGRSFNQQAGLQAHLVSHSDERPFTCLKCKKCFKYPSQIKHHACRPDEIGPSFVHTSLFEVENPDATNTLGTLDTTITCRESEENNQTAPSTADISDAISTSEPGNTIILIQIENAPSSDETPMSVDVVTTHENNAPPRDAIASTACVGIETGKDAPNISDKEGKDTPDISENTQIATTSNSGASFFSSSKVIQTQAEEGHGGYTVETAENLRNVDLSHVPATGGSTQARYVNNANALTSYTSAQDCFTGTYQHNSVSESVDTRICSLVVARTQAQACIGISHGMGVVAQSNSLPAQEANVVWPHGEITHVLRNDRSSDEGAKQNLSDQFQQPKLSEARTPDTAGGSQEIFSEPSAHL